jgi:hypothetical protein
MEGPVRAIPREKRKADVDLEQQRSKKATEKASEDAAVWKRTSVRRTMERQSGSASWREWG